MYEARRRASITHKIKHRLPHEVLFHPGTAKRLFIFSVVFQCDRKLHSARHESGSSSTPRRPCSTASDTRPLLTLKKAKITLA